MKGIKIRIEYRLEYVRCHFEGAKGIKAYMNVFQHGDNMLCYTYVYGINENDMYEELSNTCCFYESAVKEIKRVINENRKRCEYFYGENNTDFDWSIVKEIGC